MPKSAPRRKRIRTARQEADPIGTTSGPNGSSSSANDGKSNSENVSTTKTSSSSSSSKKKKVATTAGQERDKQLGPVLAKLSSDSADDRLWAVAATSHILASADPGTRRALQSKNIVGLLLERLSDNQVEVQAEACGALRNLAIEGGHEVCAEMSNKGIVSKLNSQLAIVSSALDNFISGVKPSSDAEIRVRKVLWTWIKHVATIFWCLAETSDKAFKSIVTIQSLSNFLYQIIKEAVPVDGSDLAKSKIPPAVALAAAQAVYVLTDVNVPSAPKFPLPRDVSKSAAYSNTSTMLLASLRNLSRHLEKNKVATDSSDPSDQSQSLFVMLVGIYQNLSQHKAFGKSARSDSSHDEHEFTVLAVRFLSSILQSSNLHNDAELALQYHRNMAVGNTAVSAPQALLAELAEVSPNRQRLSSIEDKWTRVRLALEILGELVAGVDGILDSAFAGEEEEYEEWNGIGDGPEQRGQPGAASANGDQEVDMSEDLGQEGTATQQYPIPISNDIGRVMQELPVILLALAQPSIVSFATLTTPQQASNDPSLIPTQTNTGNNAEQATAVQSPNHAYVPAITEVFSSVHVRALECLNNLLITLGRAIQVEAPGDDRDKDETEKEIVIETFDDLGSDAEMEEDTSETLSEGVDLVLDGENGDGAPAPSGYVVDNLHTLQKTWESLFKLLVGLVSVWETEQSSKKLSGSDDVLLAVEATVGCIWALARLGVKHITFGQDEHAVLLRVLARSQADGKYTDITLRCIGALGQLAIRDSVSVQENETIGTTLMVSLNEPQMSRHTGADVGAIDIYAQILDVLFDIYGEEERIYDVVFRKHGFLASLQAVLPTFRRLTKSVDKRKHPDTRAAADAAVTNLAEFISYRKSVAKKV